MFGNGEVVKHFLENKEKYKIDLEWIYFNSGSPTTAIELAVSNNQIHIAKLLFQYNAKCDNVNFLLKKLISY